MKLLSGGDSLRLELPCRHGLGLRHGVMRHFRIRQLVLTSPPVSDLGGGMKPPSLQLATVGGPGAAERIPPL
jgi:hypothetical protein